MDYGTGVAIRLGMNAQDKTGRKFGDYTGLVLRFSTKSGTGNPATLHASTCNVAKANNRKVYTITENLEDNIADLLDRGYTVKRCACCK